MRDLISLVLINLYFLSYTCLINDVSSNISIGKKYHGVPKLGNGDEWGQKGPIMEKLF